MRDLMYFALGFFAAWVWLIVRELDLYYNIKQMFKEWKIDEQTRRKR